MIIHSCVCQQIISKSITEYKQKRKNISVKGYQKDIEEMKMVSSLLFASRSFPAKFGLTKRLAVKLRAKWKFLSNC